MEVDLGLCLFPAMKRVTRQAKAEAVGGVYVGNPLPGLEPLVAARG